MKAAARRSCNGITSRTARRERRGDRIGGDGGVLEDWGVRVLEYWSDGVLERPASVRWTAGFRPCLGCPVCHHPEREFGAGSGHEAQEAQIVAAVVGIGVNF